MKYANDLRRGEEEIIRIIKKEPRKSMYFQVRWKLNIWTRIIGDQIIGPCVLPNRMRGDDYTDFL